jgi:release factor glutamine methyltransferase
VTVAEALAHAAGRVAAFDARLLLENASGLDAAGVLAHPETALDRAASERFAIMLERRARGEPVAYITGSAGFYGRTFAVDPRALIPRPETEHLVEAVLDYIRDFPVLRVRIADVGTGSGAIAITLAAEDERVEAVASDLSADALALASENARRLGLSARVTFAQGDLLEPLRGLERFDVLVANLPYVPSASVPQKPHPVGYEPRLALDGGEDGLALYRRLLACAAPRLSSGGALFLEAAPDTIAALADAAEAAFPKSGIEIGTDYAGLDRYVTVIV